MADKPKVAFYWCASCGGCEEAVVDLEEHHAVQPEAVVGQQGVERPGLRLRSREAV